MLAAVRDLVACERERFAAGHPTSLARRGNGWLAGSPGIAQTRWPMGVPLAVAEASGSWLVDADGNEFVDAALGDGAVLAGHAAAAVVEAVAGVLRTGTAGALLPSPDADRARTLLADRFRLPVWTLATTAGDALRWALRIARHTTGRQRVLVFSQAVHANADETLVVLDSGRPRMRHGTVGAAVNPITTTRVVEWNDLDAVERELAEGDVACVLAEPALTRPDIVAPDEHFHEELRGLTRHAGVQLVLDETRTAAAGFGGGTRRWALEPDLVVLGESIGGGVPVAAIGMTDDVAARLLDAGEVDLADAGGIGSGLAGGPVATGAVAATLGCVLTADAHEAMERAAARCANGLAASMARHGADWSVQRLGARISIGYGALPRTGFDAAAALDDELDGYLRLFALNRGVLLGPGRPTALMCPATSATDVDRVVDVVDAALDALTGG